MWKLCFDKKHVLLQLEITRILVKGFVYECTEVEFQ